MSQIYDYERRRYMTSNVAVLSLRMSQLYDCELRSYMSRNVAVDYECCSCNVANVPDMTTNVAVCNCTNVAGDDDCAAENFTWPVFPGYHDFLGCPGTPNFLNVFICFYMILYVFYVILYGFYMILHGIYMSLYVFYMILYCFYMIFL